MYRRKNRNLGRILFGLAVATFFVGLLLNRLEWQSVKSAILSVSPAPILLGLILLCAGFSTRILRWWWMLRAIEPKLSYSSCLPPYLISLAVNNTLPFRAGDIYRIFGFVKELRSPPMCILGTLVIERLLDFFVLLSFFFIGIARAEINQIPYSLLRGMLVIGAISSLGLLFLIFVPNQIKTLLTWIVQRQCLKKWSSKLELQLEHLFSALSLLSSPKLALQLLLLSIITWTFEGGMFATVAWSLQAHARPEGAWFALATGTLSTLIPSSPGYVGTFDYFTMLGLTSYGAKREVATVFALLVHLILWVPVTAIGGLLLALKYKTSFRANRENLSSQFSYPSHPLEVSELSRDQISHQPHVIVIGGGFTGLAAAYELTRVNVKVTLLEADETLGGLAGSFQVNGEPLEKFYHHWFTNDKYVMELIKQLREEHRVIYRPTRTGIYYANNFFKLSTPLDLLRFKPLNFVNRIRLGLLVLRARLVRDWKKLESLTAQQWLINLCGDEVFKIVWEPLLRGKFGPFASDISAVWFWNKIKLRGGSRSKDAGEMLAYYRGGFAALADRIAREIESRGNTIHTSTVAKGLIVEEGRVRGVKTSKGIIFGDAVIATPALPIIANLLAPHVAPEYTAKLRRINYLANVCLVLELDRSLSKTYWLNVNEPSFPFVGLIEHTNFEPKETYGGRHIVYLSKYLPESAELYHMSDEEALNFALPHIKRMFPEFSRDWILDFHFWRARYSQPIVERNYSSLIPPKESPLDNFYVCTMAQIYPEDRGTNYAIRDGRKIAQLVAQKLLRPTCL